MSKNHVAEWYGHRVYPGVAATSAALTDQRSCRCPFLSRAVGTRRDCVKPLPAQGVCTVSSVSNGPRQDWLVCPFRALDDDLLLDVTRRLFKHPAEDVLIVAATRLDDDSQCDRILDAVQAGVPVVVHFQTKLGGEISGSKTDRSPELSFDATLVELLPGQSGPLLGRYGIFEVQTMDYHGSYRHAVQALRSALDLHGDRFHDILAANTEWLARRMEGPNIANVFKRTFYQMMFKFQIGAHASCAGCALAIPKAVWDSWQRHLGAPELVDNGDGTHAFAAGRPEPGSRSPAWIYVFDLAESTDISPNRLALWRVIATDAATLSHYALDVAPAAALEAGGSADRVLDSVRRRLTGRLRVP